LLLRAVAGASALAQVGAYLSSGPEGAPASWALAGLAMVSGAGLVAGFLTPVAAAGVILSAVAVAFSTAPAAGSGLAAHWQGPSFVAAVALALAMLGPGALSIDAWLFGRREIIIPDAPRRPTGR
jgi:uncharacterized membrane protein YphA (DoxX/SURF4 family)